MNQQFDLISMGEAVVEVFRKEIDVPLHEAGDFTSPYPSGAPAITTDTMARLGGRTAFVATVGDDEFGTTLINRLSGDGVDTTHIHRVERVMTGLAFTSYFSDGSRKFIFNFTTAAAAYLDESHIDPELFARTKWLHVSGNVLAFSPLARQAVIKAVEIAHAAGASISLDPNIRLEIMEADWIEELMRPVLEKTTLLLPSVGELNQVFGADRGEESIIQDLLSTNVQMGGPTQRWDSLPTESARWPPRSMVQWRGPRVWTK